MQISSRIRRLGIFSLRPRFLRRGLAWAPQVIIMLDLFRFGMLATCFLNFLFITLATCRAQVPLLRLSQLDHVSWTNKEGAPTDIRDIAEDADGMLWVASASGLYMFDGFRFTLFRQAAGQPPLPFVGISCMEIAHDETIWIGSRLKGIVAIRNGHLRIYGEKDGLAPGTVTQIKESKKGVIWTVAQNRLFHLEANHWIEETAASRLPLRSVDRIFFDKRGTLWVGEKDGLYSRLAASAVFVKRSQKRLLVGAFGEAPDGTVWEEVNNGEDGVTSVKRICAQDGSPTPSYKPVVVAHNGNGLLFDTRGSLWAITRTEGLVRARIWSDTATGISKFAVMAETFNQTTGLTSNVINFIYESKQGTIWIGTNRGLDRFTYPELIRFKEVSLGPGPGVSVDANGSAWIFSGYSRLLSVRGGHTTPYGIAHDIHIVYGDREGCIWFEDAGGLWRYDGRVLHHIAYPSGVSPPVLIHRLTGIGENDLFASVMRNGLWHLNDGKWERVSAPGFPNDTPMSVLEDRTGRLWAGYIDNRIALLQSGVGRTYTLSDNGGLGVIEVLAETRDGIVAGGSNGVAVLQDGEFKVLRASNEFMLRGISGIVEADNGDLWMNGTDGIVRIRASEVRAALSSNNHRVQLEQFLSDGVPVDPSVDISTVPTAVKAGDGTLWFASITQIISIAPDKLQSFRTPPEVSLRTISGDGTILPSDKPLSLDHIETLRLSYSAIDLTDPERVRYRYRLDGQDRHWQDASTGTEAVYQNLHSGSYIFHVAASRDGENWRELVKPLVFRIRPRFYETLWFQVFCLMFSGSIIWFLFTLRLKYRSIRIQDRADERIRIARDLHDTLLQSVQGLMLRFHVAAQDVPDNSHARTMLEKALKAADGVLLEGRARVKSLRSNSLNDLSLPEAIEGVGAHLIHLEEISFSVTTQGAVVRLDPIVSEEIFCIAREAITNSFHHSHATHITVTVTYGRADLRLFCNDDGSGIPPNILKAYRREGHWGLVGMKERAKKIGAAFKCESSPESGTSITVSVPAILAYSDTGMIRSIFLDCRRLIGI